MATEPPPKRLRLTYPDEPEPDSDLDNDQDGDELIFEPEEIIERRDPDNKLTRKRFRALTRFEQAFSGIFAKYGKNFDQVGDEIDWRTGEMVTDNGHLQNMRHEFDVGVEEEEEGLLLGSLVDEDEEEEEGVRLDDLRDEWEDDDIGTDEEERIMMGQAAAPSLKANPLAKFVDAGQPVNLHVPPQDTQAANLPLLPAEKPRQRSEDDVPVWARYSGAQSIWASELGYEPQWAPIPSSRVGTFGSLRQTPSKPQLQLPAPEASSAGMLVGVDFPREGEKAIQEETCAEDEDDLMAACQATEPSRPPQSTSPASGRVMIMRTLRGVPEKPVEKSKASPKPALKVSTPKLKSHKKKMTSPKPTPFNQVAIVRKPLLAPTPPPSDPNCRRSARARYKTDYLGMVSWADAVRKESKNFVVELPSPTICREEYISMPQRLPTPPDSGPETEHVQVPAHERTIQDSQETRESRESRKSSPSRTEEIFYDVPEVQEEAVAPDHRAGQARPSPPSQTLEATDHTEINQPEEFDPIEMQWEADSVFSDPAAPIYYAVKELSKAASTAVRDSTEVPHRRRNGPVAHHSPPKSSLDSMLLDVAPVEEETEPSEEPTILSQQPVLPADQFGATEQAVFRSERAHV